MSRPSLMRRTEKGIILEQLFFKNRPDKKQDWLSQNNNCVFMEHYAKAFTSLLYLAISDHQLGIDRNDRNDAEQLAFLLYADVLVSDDQKYMKKAFELLYGSSTNKQLLTSDQFLVYLNSL